MWDSTPRSPSGWPPEIPSWGLPTPAMAGLSSATVPKRAIDSDFTAAVLGGFGEGPRYGYHVGAWVAAAAVRTPAIWRWPSSLTHGMVSTLPAAERTLRIVARALRTNDQVHVAEEAQILSLRGKTPAAISGAKAIAISTVPLSPGLLQGVNQGLTTLPSNVASVCASVANPEMGPCNQLTILWVRPGSAAYGPQSRFVGEPP